MNKRLTDTQVSDILSALRFGVKQSEIAARFGISQSYVSRLKSSSRRVLDIRKINRKSPGNMTLKRAL